MVNARRGSFVVVTSVTHGGGCCGECVCVLGLKKRGTTTHTCAGCNDQLFASSCKAGARAPFGAWGPGLRSGSLLAFWAQAGWEGGVGVTGWGGAAGRVGAGRRAWWMGGGDHP